MFLKTENQALQTPRIFKGEDCDMPERTTNTTKLLVVCPGQC